MRCALSEDGQIMEHRRCFTIYDFICIISIWNTLVLNEMTIKTV